MLKSIIRHPLAIAVLCMAAGAVQAAAAAVRRPPVRQPSRGAPALRYRHPHRAPSGPFHSGHRSLPTAWRARTETQDGNSAGSIPA